VILQHIILMIQEVRIRRLTLGGVIEPSGIKAKYF
jgi:hypothetical protein